MAFGALHPFVPRDISDALQRSPLHLVHLAPQPVYAESPAGGAGATRFFNPAFGELACVPERGKALVFPTATLRGEADERYLHSGEPVEAGTKWIIGTWLMETERKDGEQIAKAIDELWKLARK